MYNSLVLFMVVAERNPTQAQLCNSPKFIDFVSCLRLCWAGMTFSLASGSCSQQCFAREMLGGIGRKTIDRRNQNWPSVREMGASMSPRI